MPKIIILSGMRLGLVFILLGLVSCYRKIPVPSEQERKAYRQAIESVATWVEREYTDKGAYPASLPPVVQSKLECLNVPIKYSAYKNNLAYEIVIGDYNRNEWTYVYDSCSKKWMLDN